MKMDATREFLLRTNGTAFAGGSKELASFLRQEIKTWEMLSRIAKIEPQ
jgi:hypothetical protein